ncbi:MAG: CHC2 zinc finger domain-containing protein [Candidatus Thorarchaeota archaeon]|jgi:hypothetical protein
MGEVSDLDWIEILLAEGVIVEEAKYNSGEYPVICPLHDDSDPSMHINFDKEVYHCKAGCGGGSLLQLIAILRNEEIDIVSKDLHYEDHTKTLDFLALRLMKKPLSKLDSIERIQLDGLAISLEKNEFFPSLLGKQDLEMVTPKNFSPPPMKYRASDPTMTVTQVLPKYELDEYPYQSSKGDSTAIHLHGTPLESSNGKIHYGFLSLIGMLIMSVTLRGSAKARSLVISTLVVWLLVMWYLV